MGSFCHPYNPCKNGATCKDPESFLGEPRAAFQTEEVGTCVCQHGFNGKFCENSKYDVFLSVVDLPFQKIISSLECFHCVGFGALENARNVLKKCNFNFR